jgi:hypothetical protein
LIVNLPTTDIQYLQSRRILGKTQLGSKVVFMPPDGFCKRLIGITIGEMERLSPSPLIEKSSEIVV